MYPWIKAARLRTLPLAVSGILLGSALAFLYNYFHWQVMVLGLITAVLLQILSNYANDYGDFLKGTDSVAGRKDRTLASGEISPTAMKTALFILGVLCFLSGLALLGFAFPAMGAQFFIFLILGIAAIGAAVLYTVGKKAYGYAGLGDIFVFVFFGIISVVGIFALHASVFENAVVWMAALGSGFLSVAVLNINNTRDIETDKKSAKKTLAVRFGKSFALQYHSKLVWLGFALVVGSFIFHIFSTVEKPNQIEFLLIAVVFSPIALLLTGHIHRMKAAQDDDRTAFNKELKTLSLSILLLVVEYWILCWFYIG